MFYVVQMLTETDKLELSIKEILEYIKVYIDASISRPTLEKSLLRHCKDGKYICHGTERGMYGLVERLQPKEGYDLYGE